MTQPRDQALMDSRIADLEEKVRRLEAERTSFLQQMAYLQVDGLEIGADFFRGEQGFFQMNVGLEQRGGLVFVDEFINQDQIGSYSPLNSVEGRADGVITHLQLVSRDSATGQAILTVRGKATTVIEGQSYDGTNTGKFQLYPTYFQVDGIPVLFGARTSDPTPSNGMVWHRSDLSKLRARLGGTTENLATESYVDAAGGGGLKTSGGGYYLIPAGPALGTSVTQSSSANTYGSWTQMRAASGNALYIVGISIEIDTAGGGSTIDYVQVDIGTGGAGAESSVSELKFPIETTNEVPWYTVLPFPVPVAANTRIACRTASEVPSSIVYGITLHVIDQADLVSI